MPYRNELELLRLTTCGSVDDGKSTLIGRLLLDTKSIHADQYAAVESSSRRKGLSGIDLAFFTDGLKDEREQGITIDVAYRYFATAKRKFIIADTPGHIQYTRNMVTGASTANVVLILVDARNGIVEQTCRHSFIASLLRIPHVVVCINKMDLIDYSQEKYEKIVEDFRMFSSRLDIQDVQFIPISAKHGDNVVERSSKMPWYQGSTLMFHLDNVHLSGDLNHIDCRFPVQYIIRHEMNGKNYRGYSGTIAGGVFRQGDEIVVLPSGYSTRIKSINTYDGELKEAFAPMAVSIQTEDELDISRGDILVRENNAPQSSQDIELMVCWFNDKTLQEGSRLILRHTTRELRCIVKEIRYKIDINTLRRNQDEKVFGMNDIGRIHIRTTQPLFYDSYRRNRNTGGMIFIDEATNETVGAGMII